MAAMGRGPASLAALQDKVGLCSTALNGSLPNKCDRLDTRRKGDIRAWNRQVAAHRARIAADAWDAVAWQALAIDVGRAIGPGKPAPELLALYRSVMEQLLAQFPTAVCRSQVAIGSAEGATACTVFVLCSRF